MIDKIRPLYTRFNYTQRMTVTATQKRCSSNAIPVRTGYLKNPSLLRKIAQEA
jgi:hypothetical protein